MDLEALWSTARSSVLPAATSPAQQNWLKDTTAVGYAHPTVILAAPHQFARDWIDSELGDPIAQALSEAAHDELQALITVQPNPEAPAAEEAIELDEPTVEEERPLDAPGRPPGPVGPRATSSRPGHR